MSRAEPGREGPFHELPLVLFTALAMAGGGIGTAHLLGSVVSWLPWVPAPRILGLTVGLTALGFLASIPHLGRPLRALRALARLGRSPLSNEVALVLLALATGVAALVLPEGQVLRRPLAVVAVACGPMILLALGAVYRLRAQLSWDGPAALHPLVLGSAYGFVALLALSPVGPGTRAILAILLGVDIVLFGLRARKAETAAGRGAPAHPAILARIPALSWLRFALLDLPAAAVALAGHPGLTASVAALVMVPGLLLDRVLFYGLAVVDSTESQVARVERMLETVGPALAETSPAARSSARAAAPPGEMP